MNPNPNPYDLKLLDNLDPRVDRKHETHRSRSTGHGSSSGYGNNATQSATMALRMLHLVSMWF
ncbi:hypothetical protein EYZ11_005464 [Aspergillus tanneri]|uniref:Uncharacterized protein n=1 Tax=Aspergillus tanneri TaxID=1220188 RepID=A0A4S3JHX4_9EURO|nr:uncharacterized protein ATNIH1004_008286 [Aspergillus tanneri]KAA8644088.1 hypothetical protein ATNIH1004_008286 [Aspergillus tanneri]THC95069.1 hypothetical protein EYZ11_005464 [Aspergillus tanneri]